jgi:hypothetical protein
VGSSTGGARAAFALAVASCLLPTGCGYAVFQTAHTEPPGKPSVAIGAATTFNGYDQEAERSALTNGVADATVRFGLTDQIDIGVGPYLFPGGQVDVKANVFDRRMRLALAPRAGAGASFVAYGDRTALAFAGVIGSYRVANWVEPYLAVTVSDQWVRRAPPDVDLAVNEQLAPRQHTGNGLLRTHLGIQLSTSQRFALLAECGRWTPLWNDPGDSYKLVDSYVLAVGVRFSGREPE